jgi:hypothetical protein
MELKVITPGRYGTVLEYCRKKFESNKSIISNVLLDLIAITVG